MTVWTLFQAHHCRYAGVLPTVGSHAIGCDRWDERSIAAHIGYGTVDTTDNGHYAGLPDMGSCAALHRGHLPLLAMWN